MITRYPEVSAVASKLDPLEDLQSFARFLLAREYVTDLLRERHALTATDAKQRALAVLRFLTETQPDSSIRPMAILESKAPARVQELRALNRYRTYNPAGVAIAKPQFLGPKFPKGTNPAEAIRDSLRLFLVYHPNEPDDLERVRTPVSSRRVFLPEEFNIALAMFLSCVVRYKPDCLDRLCTTRFWPVIESLRRHALLKFLTLFWSFMQQRTFMLVNP